MRYISRILLVSIIIVLVIVISFVIYQILQSQRSFIVMRCHKNSDDLQRYILEKGIDVVLFDETGGVCTMTLPGVRIIRLTQKLMQSMHKYHKDQWYSLEAQIVYCARKLHYPKFLWFVEYDVYTNSTFPLMLNKYNETSEADYICTKLFKHENFKEWKWFSPDERMGSIQKYNIDQLRGSYLMIFRVSKKAIVALEKLVLEKMGGYCEMLLPTFFANHDLIMSTLNESDLGTMNPGPPGLPRSDILPSDIRFHHPVFDLSI